MCANITNFTRIPFLQSPAYNYMGNIDQERGKSALTLSLKYTSYEICHRISKAKSRTSLRSRVRIRHQNPI